MTDSREQPATSNTVARALVAMVAAIATLSMPPAVAHAAFPGTNGNLAFGSARSGYPADNDLYTMANNGTTQARITSMNLDELNPSWSPSGTEVVFERNTGLRSDIWIAEADGSNPRRLTTHPGNDKRPAFSNTGTKIVFASDRNSTAGTSDLFVMDANGANQVAVTNTPTIDEGYPSWSPDGTAIVFSRDGDIYKASPSGANLTRLTTSAITEFEPDWSPSSSQIVFRQGINGNDELWKINANGSGLTPLAHNGSVVEEHPVWSPQGDKIAFIRGAFKDAEVYTMNADGSGVTRITNNTVMDASPAWQAIPSSRPPPQPPSTPPPSSPPPPIPPNPQPPPPTGPGSSATPPGFPGMNVGAPSGLAMVVTDKAAPSAKLTFAKRQRAANVSVVVQLNEAGTVIGVGSVAAPGGAGKGHKFKSVSLSVNANAKTKLRLKFPTKALKVIKRALQRARLKAKVTISARDQAGNKRTWKATIELKR